MKIILRFFIFFLVPFTSFSQSLQNIRAQQTGNLIVVNYDLIGVEPGEMYDVKLYSSLDYYAQPLVSVKGDVGQMVEPGTNRKIEWEAKNDIKKYEGLISFEVKAELAFTPLKLVKPLMGGTYKRGKTYPITWKGGYKKENLSMNIYKGESLIASIPDIPNSGKFNWQVPKDAEKRSDYRLSLVQKNLTVSSNSLKIKRRTSVAAKVFWLFIVPVGGVTAAYIVTQGGEGPRNDCPTCGQGGGEVLPLPPTP